MIPPTPAFVSHLSGGSRPPSAFGSLVLTVLFAGTALTVAWAASNPEVAAVAVALVVGGGAASRLVRRGLERRRRAGRTRRICLEGVGVCVDV